MMRLTKCVGNEAERHCGGCLSDFFERRLNRNGRANYCCHCEGNIVEHSVDGVMFRPAVLDDLPNNPEAREAIYQYFREQPDGLHEAPEDRDQRWGRLEAEHLPNLEWIVDEQAPIDVAQLPEWQNRRAVGGNWIEENAQRLANEQDERIEAALFNAAAPAAGAPPAEGDAIRVEGNWALRNEPMRIPYNRLRAELNDAARRFRPAPEVQWNLNAVQQAFYNADLAKQVACPAPTFDEFDDDGGDENV